MDPLYGGILSNALCALLTSGGKLLFIKHSQKVVAETEGRRKPFLKKVLL
jgi:hypothetical protein